MWNALSFSFACRQIYGKIKERIGGICEKYRSEINSSKVSLCT